MVGLSLFRTSVLALLISTLPVASLDAWIGSTGSPVVSLLGSPPSTSWPAFGNNPWNDRFSPDGALTPRAVRSLKLAFRVLIPGTRGTAESYPLEEDGIVFVTTPRSAVFALSAATGQTLWRVMPTLHLMGATPLINRGVALGRGRVYVLTPDDRLLSMNEKTGHVLYSVTVASQKNGYFESAAPLYADGVVFVGSAGGDLGVRGWASGFDAVTGAPVWRFYTVPARGTGWVAAQGNHGGGAVWTTPAYDPLTGTVFFGTGNPSPDYFGAARPGPDPYTDSVVGLSLSTGTLAWAGQEVPHDLWDYDAASPPLLFPVDGRLVVGEAGKDGFYYEWDALTGSPVISPVAFVRQDHTPPTPQGTWEWPGADGGANYGPSAYDPKTGDVYVTGINGPTLLKGGPSRHTPGYLDLGTSEVDPPAKDFTGTVTAIDATTGKIRWQVPTTTPPIGGVTATAGGTVFFGLEGGEIEGLSALTGRPVWSADPGIPIGTAPIVYTDAGRTYLLVVAGGAQSFKNFFPWHGPEEVLVYRL